MSIQISPRHETAREFARTGIRVFPCVAGGKIPACANGFHDATTDLAQIDAWWSQEDYNLAISPEHAGWAVVDIEADGIAAWEAIEGDKPATYTVRSPRGGLHLYYAGSLPSTVRKLAEGEAIDTRGKGGYVLVPPSIVGGRPYEVVDDRDIAPLPAWVASRVETRNDRVRAAVADLDDRGNIERARTLLDSLVRRGDVAVAGRGGNNRTYQLACEVQNLGISPETCRDLLAEKWNEHCVPPWSADELHTICTNAASYAQNEAGAWAVPPAAETFSPDTLASVLSDPRPEARSRFYFEDVLEQEAAKETPWLVPDLIPDQTFVLMIGPKGNFKSFLAHALAMGIAANKETLGLKPVRAGSVFFGAHEGRNEIKRARRHAWEIAHEMRGAEYPLYVAPAPRIAMEDEIEEFKEAIRDRLRRPGAKKAAAIFLDTVAKCMVGLDENSAMDAGRFVALCDDLVYEFQCPVIALHHTPKHGSKLGRGSGAFEAGAGTVLDVERSGRVVSLKVRHHKDAEEREMPFIFEGKTIGPSLVFFPLSEQEHAAILAADDLCDKRKVGAALKRLNAYGWDHGVTSVVLATELAPADQNEDEETRQTRVEALAKELGRLSRTRLAPYCEKRGRDLRWYLPAQAEAEKET